jgi:hypothetical protein
MNNKLIYTLFSFIVMIIAYGCDSHYDVNDYDSGDPYQYSLSINGTEISPLVSFAAVDSSSIYLVKVKSNIKVKSAVNVQLTLDTTLVSKYNKAHNTSYCDPPAGSIELADNQVSIDAKKNVSSAASLKILNAQALVDTITYLIPVTITAITDTTNFRIVEKSKTIYLTLLLKKPTVINQDSKKDSVAVLDLSNYNMYSNFIFDDAKAVSLTSYTMEIKFYANKFGSYGGQIERLCAFEEKDEKNANMLRFGENGLAGNQLQWVAPGGNKVNSNTRFNAGQWYNLSLVYDGSQFILYVDGSKDTSKSVSGKSCKFQRIELGMSWAGYPSAQQFPGRICEMRVWNRALSASEITDGLCSVAPKSDGLVAYWKFNEGSGFIFKDATGNGYDMDWSNTWRCLDESSSISNVNLSSYVQWITKGFKCASN